MYIEQHALHTAILRQNFHVVHRRATFTNHAPVSDHKIQEMHIESCVNTPYMPVQSTQSTKSKKQTWSISSSTLHIPWGISRRIIVHT